MKRIIAHAAFAAPLALAIAWATPSAANDLSGKKVLFVDSYHQGFSWSDGIAAGVNSVLKGSGVELEMIHMDTKRNSDEAFIKKAVQEVKEKIESFQPDVVIACDDNASKYMIVPHYVGSKLPFVFCGVNGTAEPYGFPTSNVTGMVEIDAVEGLTRLLSSIAGSDNAGFIGSNTTSSKKSFEQYEKNLGRKIEARFVNDFEEFKNKFLELQKVVDYIIIDSPSPVKGWDDDQAEAFMLANTKKPTGGFTPDLLRFVVVGFQKLPEEQGEWAANAAKKILAGTPVSDIPIAHNEKGQVVVNSKIANSAGIEVPYSVIEIADRVM